MEKLKYVSSEYQLSLENLATSLVTGRRFGGAALEQTVVGPDLTVQLVLGE